MNYTPLIADLDKATLEINQVKILPLPNKLASTLVKLKNTKYSKLYEIRNSCKRNTRLCNKFKSYQYDIIVLLYDIYTLFYINVFKKINVDLRIYLQKLNILNKFVRKTLNLNQEKFEIFHNRIIHKFFLKYYEHKTISIHVNTMVYYLCKNLHKAEATAKAKVKTTKAKAKVKTKVKTKVKANKKKKMSKKKKKS